MRARWRKVGCWRLCGRFSSCHQNCFPVSRLPFPRLPKCFPDRNTIVRNGKTREDLFQATVKRTRALLEAGFNVVEVWACEVGRKPKTSSKTFPHAILYDFEAFGDTNQRKEATVAITLEAVHVPISVCVGDTLERAPTHICKRDPKELVRKFVKELERGGRTSGKRCERSFSRRTSTCCRNSAAPRSKNGATRCRSSGSTRAATTSTLSKSILWSR